MFRTYLSIRRVVVWLFLVILAALIGEFAIEVGREHGFYERPTAKIAAAMKFMAALRDAFWFWPLICGFGGLLAGMYLDAFMRRYAERNSEGEHDKEPSKDLQAIQIEFRWRPGGQNDPIQIDAFVTAIETTKDLAVIGTAAKATHYLSGKAEWVWQPSVRLLGAQDFFKGENKSAPILRCDRVDSGRNGVLLLNTYAVPVTHSETVLVRIRAVSGAQTWQREAAYFVKRLGEYLDVQPAPDSLLQIISDAGKQA